MTEVQKVSVENENTIQGVGAIHSLNVIQLIDDLIVNVGKTFVLSNTYILASKQTVGICTLLYTKGKLSFDIFKKLRIKITAKNDYMSINVLDEKENNTFELIELIKTE